jgi:hypothetical protein
MALNAYKKFKKTILLIQFAVLFLTNSCSSLSKSQIINSKKTEAISILELKILNNGEEEKSNSGVFGECHLVFDSDNGNVKSSNSDDYSFYIIKTKPGIVKIKALKCSNWIVYFKNRHLNLGDLEFIAKSDYINYLGNLVINYEPRGFGFLDIFALGGIISDSKASFDIKIYDNTEKSVKFLKEYYSELKNRNIVKSIIHNRKNTKAKLKDLEEREKIKSKNIINKNEFKIENDPKNFDQNNQGNQGFNPQNTSPNFNENNYNNSNGYQQNPSNINNNQPNPSNVNSYQQNQPNQINPNNYQQNQSTPNFYQQNKIKTDSYQQPNSQSSYSPYPNDNKISQYPNQNYEPRSSSAIVPVISQETQQNISSQPRAINSNPISISDEKIAEDISSEQINKKTNSNNNKIIGQIIRRNRNLRENSNTQPVNNPPISNSTIQESSSPISRFRPNDVQ